MDGFLLGNLIPCDRWDEDGFVFGGFVWENVDCL